jgi:formiminotetrahydrofolate cyclodeaminase
MVAGLSRKKKSQAAHVNQLSETLDQLRRNAAELSEAIDRDAAAYDAVMAAYKLPQESDEEKRQRDDAIQSATRGAAEVPLQVAERSVALFERLGQLASIAAASMKSDLEVARLMASAAARGALANVEINLESIADANYVASTRAKSAALRERLSETSRSISA